MKIYLYYLLPNDNPNFCWDLHHNRFGSREHGLTSITETEKKQNKYMYIFISKINDEYVHAVLLSKYIIIVF